MNTVDWMNVCMNEWMNEWILSKDGWIGEWENYSSSSWLPLSKVFISFSEGINIRYFKILLFGF